MEYFFDNQIRRYILQFIRIFSEIKIEVSPGVMRRVPIKYGAMSRMVAMILRDNNPNKVMTAPHLSAWVGSLEMVPERRQDPMLVRSVRAVERHYDTELGAYSSDSDNRFTVRSMMPVPYTLNMNLDVWTTNTTDKFQVLEQILTVFNPSVQIQTNDNPVDWTSIVEVELTGINWSSRSVPSGTDDVNDIANLTFKLPIWITPPSQVSRQRVIETIITNLYDGTVEEEQVRGALDFFGSCFDKIKEFVVTPDNLAVSVEPESGLQSRVRALGDTQWRDLFPFKGNVEFNGGLLTLKTLDDIESTQGDIVGVVTVDGDDLLFDPDPDSLPPADFEVNAIVDPTLVWPGNGLPALSPGDRFLLIDDQAIGAVGQNLVPEEPNGPWQGAWGREWSVIEWTGSEWLALFDPETHTGDPVYLINQDDGQHYAFRDGGWSYTYLGEYTPGYWRLAV